MRVDKALRELLVKLGAKGGKARAAILTPEERQSIAKKAAKARWSKKRPTGKEGQ